MNRNPETVKNQVKVLIRKLAEAGYDRKFIQANVRFHLTRDEAAALMEHNNGRRTLCGDDGDPTGQPLSLWGLRISTEDVKW